MRSIVALAIAALGFIWLYGVKILSGIGRVFDLVSLGDYVTDLQLWIVANPNLMNEYGPWALISGGFISLIATHTVPPIYRAFRQDALEIVYNPADEKGQFGGVGKWYKYRGPADDPSFTAYIFRIGVKNNTGKTIYDVKGTVEGELVNRQIPVALRFSRTLELEGNIDPGRMLLMDVFAMPPNPADWEEGVHKIIIRINGRDTPETMARFCIDRSRMPAMYAEL